MKLIQHMKKIISCFVLITFMIHLGGCVTTHNLGEGIVVSKKHLNNKPKLEVGDNTITGAKVGGKIGAVGGGAIGGAIGLVPGVLSQSAAGVLISIAICGAIGAGIFGLATGVVGAALGYAGDLVIQNTPEYEFNIKSLQDSQNFIIRQRTGSSIPLNSKVIILEKKGQLFIKKR